MEIKDTKLALRVGGLAELTAANSERIRKQICTALNGHTTIEIDLSRTMVMDCAGLGTLIALRGFVRDRHGVIRLVRPTPAVQQLLDCMRVTSLFEIVNLPLTDQPNHPDYSPSSLSTLLASFAKRLYHQESAN